MKPPHASGESTSIANWGAWTERRARDGAVNEIRQERIPDVAYQAQLDEEVDEDAAEPPPDPEKSFIVPPLRASDVRYWSDNNRVYYLPSSIHKLPDLADWEAEEGDWQGGKETFSR
jgi:Tubulin domain